MKCPVFMEIAVDGQWIPCMHRATAEIDTGEGFRLFLSYTEIKKKFTGPKWRTEEPEEVGAEPDYRWNLRNFRVHRKMATAVTDANYRLS